VPFTARFGVLTRGDRLLYFATLAMPGAAAVLLIAPSSHHRILFRCGDKEHIVKMANRYAIAGLTCASAVHAGLARVDGAAHASRQPPEISGTCSPRCTPARPRRGPRGAIAAHRAGHHLDRDRVRIARRVNKRCAIVVRWREVGHEQPDMARH
jgi:hypothetical protein